MYLTPYFVIYVDLGDSGPPSSFSLIPTLTMSQHTIHLTFDLNFDKNRPISKTLSLSVF